MKKRNLAAIALAVLLISAAAGCNQADTQNSTGEISIVSTDNTGKDKSLDDVISEINQDTESSQESQQTSEKSENSTEASKTSVSNGIIETTDLFSNRDLEQNPDVSDAKSLTVSEGQTVNITEEGTYVISGTASNCTIKVEVDKESKVQLVLNGVNITNESSPAIYVVSADKCFITSQGENSLSVTGTFDSDGDTNTDAVIFSKDDLVFNGTGTLTIDSSNNGISGKDDIKFTGGTYNITSVNDSIEAKDSISVYNGTFTINSSKDGFHSEDSDDDTKGTLYIADGTFNVTVKSDGLQATTAVQIDGGTFDITANEGIESTYIQINGGTINITATDDGLNGSNKSSAYSKPMVEITGGNLTVTVSGGDVDGIDSNGDIIVSGGTVNVTYPGQPPCDSFDCDGTATYTGGTIIINGEQVDSIPQSDRMGGGMGGGFGRMGRMIPNGQMPEDFSMPDGEMPQMPDGERPEFSMPDGEIPSMPDGEQPDFSKFKRRKFENSDTESAI